MPDCVGVPESVPPEDKVSPGGNPDDGADGNPVTDHVGGGEYVNAPPVAVKVTDG